MIDEQTQIEAARHVTGATMAWGEGTYYDFAYPNPEIISLEDYAYALAYTVRFRGQTRDVSGFRCFYGVGQHLVEGAQRMLEANIAPEHIRAWLFHESGEVPFGDLPGPAKGLFPGWRSFEKLHDREISQRFGVNCPDPSFIKTWDIRMFLTERRDLMLGGLNGKPITPGYEPFLKRIYPYMHPDVAALKFLNWCKTLRITDDKSV